jgi:predicted Abi (CAAX) family protease
VSEWNHEAPEPNDDIVVRLTRGNVAPEVWNRLRFDIARTVTDLIMDKYKLYVPSDRHE